MSNDILLIVEANRVPVQAAAGEAEQTKPVELEQAKAVEAGETTPKEPEEAKIAEPEEVQATDPVENKSLEPVEDKVVEPAEDKVVEPAENKIVEPEQAAVDSPTQVESAESEQTKAVKPEQAPVEPEQAKLVEFVHREPLVLKGVLDQYESFEVTPIIGKEFSTANLKEWLRAPNSDELIRDLAITISQRGVVFFRKQDDLDNDLQKELAQRLGQLSGKPETSGLHIHPVSNSGRKLGGKDDEISVISSEQAKKIYKNRFPSESKKRQSAKEGWHSDITFEPIPSDYAILRLTELPTTGGDTLWASGYELYDRLSPPYQKFFEGLTAKYAQPGFAAAAKDSGFELYSKPRGAPENVGSILEAEHPVIRTNPVTGWKSIFAVGHHVQSINGLSDLESKEALGRFVNLIADNHDLQVRHRWQNPKDLAIWDNRSVYHTATFDYAGYGKRTGQRAVSLGERPYLDPQSKSRREALNLWE